MEEKSLTSKDKTEVYNPFIITAEDSLSFFYEYGNSEFKKLMCDLGYKPDNSTDLTINDSLKQTIAIYKEIRFVAANSLFSTLKDFLFLDIGCGFTPRALLLPQLTKYIGIDLPQIIDRVNPVIKNTLPSQYNNTIFYKVADVTNPDALENILSKNKKSLFITTEGLLMYLSDFELDTMIHSITNQLEKFGGYWVTLDFDIQNFTLDLLKTICNGDLNTIHHILSSQKTKIDEFKYAFKGFTVYDNKLFQKTNIVEYFHKRSLNVTRIPLSSIISTLETARNLTPEIQKNIAALLQNHFVYVMTKDDFIRNKMTKKIKDSDFEITGHLSFNQLFLNVSGRLDSITSEKLLSAYEDFKKQSSFYSININFKNLAYISSAGLRVLLYMYKHTPEIQHFMLMHCNSTVLEVLQKTGLTDIFSCNRDSL